MNNAPTVTKEVVMKLILFSSILLFSSISFAQFRIQPTGITGYAGFGFVSYSSNQPTGAKFDIEDGVYTAIGGERGLGAANLYLSLSLNYLKSDGKADYQYTDGTTDYAAPNAEFNLDIFQVGLGLKLKLIDEYWIKPYVEGGGLFGYLQAKYNGVPTGAKRDDALFDFGYYGEGGIEFAFSNTFGLKIGYRQTKNKTKPLQTLGEQKVDYESEVYYLGLLKQF